MSLRKSTALALFSVLFLAASGGARANEADEANTSWKRPFTGAPAGAWPPCSKSVAARADNCIESVSWILAGKEIVASFVDNPEYDPSKATKPQNERGDFLDNSGQEIGRWWFEATTNRARFSVSPTPAISGTFMTIYMEGQELPLQTGDRFKIVLKSSVLKGRMLGIMSNAENPVITSYKGADGVDRFSFEATAGYAASPVLEERETAICTSNTKAVYGTVRMQINAFFAADFPYLTQYPGQLVVSTNAVHSLALPTWDGKNKIIRFTPCAPHFDINGSLYKGYYETVIGGKLARGLWGIEPSLAASLAKVEITYTDGGQADIATVTSKYDKSRDEIRLVAYNFHYSQPTISVGMRTKQVTVTCVKGKSIKKVTGTTPKCPPGWKKR